MRFIFLILCTFTVSIFASDELEQTLKAAREIDTSKTSTLENGNKGIFKQLSMKKNIYCLGVDNEKMALGTKWVFTCNTDPDTKENVWFRNCLKGEDGKAVWSKGYTEYDPRGC
jgi:hypothetical protein